MPYLGAGSRRRLRRQTRELYRDGWPALGAARKVRGISFGCGLHVAGIASSGRDGGERAEWRLVGERPCHLRSVNRCRLNKFHGKRVGRRWRQMCSRAAPTERANGGPRSRVLPRRSQHHDRLAARARFREIEPGSGRPAAEPGRALRRPFIIAPERSPCNRRPRLLPPVPGPRSLLLFRGTGLRRCQPVRD